jgi:tetratricopeptide (TPR) repeat protein
MISGQESLLSTLLILISVFLFWRHNVISACFVAFAAMLSRENALAIPLFLTAASCFAFNTMQAERQNQKILNLAAIWLTAIIYLFLRHHILQNSEAGNLIFQPSKPFMAFLYLLQTVILPEPELVYEPAELVWVSLSTVFALLIFIFALFRCRNSIGTPAAKTWATWIFIMFLPTSNLLLQQTAYDERHILIALPGFAGLFLAVSGNFLSSRPKVSLALILTMALMLGIISQNRAQYFGNEFTFASQWLKTNPHAGEPYAILGGLFRERGQLETAQEMYEIAIYYNPSLVSAYDNLGSILGNAGLHERAASILKTGVALELENPFCRYNLAMAFFNSGLYNECLAQLHLAKMYTGNKQNLNSMIDESFFHVWFSILCWRFRLTSPIF